VASGAGGIAPPNRFRVVPGREVQILTAWRGIGRRGAVGRKVAGSQGTRRRDVVVTGIALEERQVRALDAIAAVEQRSRSSVVRLAIDHELARRAAAGQVAAAR